MLKMVYFYCKFQQVWAIKIDFVTMLYNIIDIFVIMLQS